MTAPPRSSGCIVLRDELYPPTAWEAEDDYAHCCQCGAEKPDTVGLNLIETEEEEAEEYGFCSLPCLVLFVQKHYSGLVPAAAAGSGSPSAVGDRPAAAGGTQALGEVRLEQVPPTSEAGA